MVSDDRHVIEPFLSHSSLLMYARKNVLIIHVHVIRKSRFPKYCVTFITVKQGVHLCPIFCHVWGYIGRILFRRPPARRIKVWVCRLIDFFSATIHRLHTSNKSLLQGYSLCRPPGPCCAASSASTSQIPAQLSMPWIRMFHNIQFAAIRTVCLFHCVCWNTQACYQQKRRLPLDGAF